ncbi:DUF1360 domain-containing protein [Bacillus cereus]|uniref:DUF1360 domain-containing protein n=1 Tax=Bacillus cereus group TaxID=86661 RepID=UPI0012F8322A
MSVVKEENNENINKNPYIVCNLLSCVFCTGSWFCLLILITGLYDTKTNLF